GEQDGEGVRGRAARLQQGCLVEDAEGGTSVARMRGGEDRGRLGGRVVDLLGGVVLDHYLVQPRAGTRQQLLGRGQRGEDDVVGVLEPVRSLRGQDAHDR